MSRFPPVPALNLVTGLPIQWYGRDKEALVEQLRGTHAVNRVGSERRKRHDRSNCKCFEFHSSAPRLS